MPDLLGLQLIGDKVQGGGKGGGIKVGVLLGWGGGGVGMGVEKTVYPPIDRQTDRRMWKQEFSGVDAGPSAGKS